MKVYHKAGHPEEVPFRTLRCGFFKGISGKLYYKLPPNSATLFGWAVDCEEDTMDGSFAAEAMIAPAPDYVVCHRSRVKDG